MILSFTYPFFTHNIWSPRSTQSPAQLEPNSLISLANLCCLLSWPRRLTSEGVRCPMELNCLWVCWAKVSKYICSSSTLHHILCSVFGGIPIYTIKW